MVRSLVEFLQLKIVYVFFYLKKCLIILEKSINNIENIKYLTKSVMTRMVFG